MEISDLFGRTIGIHCKTEEEALGFVELAYESNCEWGDRLDSSVTTYWSEYGDKTCYDVKSGELRFTNTAYCKMHDYYIMEYSNFIKN